MTSKTEKILFTLILVCGLLVRIVSFSKIPAGLNQDEAAAAYESYALLKTGSDKWGNPYPVYFVAYGSGMSVLQSYLSIPFIMIFGLNSFTARIVALIFGCLTLPLVYFLLRYINRKTALAGMFFVAFIPWHWMLSRWGLESNLLPFFLLLGCFTFSRAILYPTRSNTAIALIPMALAFYAYGTSIVIVPLLVSAMAILCWHDIWRHIKLWLWGWLIFILLTLPYGLFMLENLLVGHSTGIGNKVFFSWPIVGNARQEGIESISGGIRRWNPEFIKTGFNDLTTYNRNPDFPLLWNIIYLLFVVGLSGVVINYLLQWKNKSIDTSIKISAIIVLWTLASLPLFTLVVLNINRANAVFLPILILAAIGFTFIHDNINTALSKRIWTIAVFMPVLLSIFLFGRNYFTVYNAQVKTDMNAGLEEAFRQLEGLEVNQIRISDQVKLNYVYTLFFTKYDPLQFRKEVEYERKGYYYHVKKFGKYLFKNEAIDTTQPYAYLSRKDEDLTLNGFEKKFVRKSEDFETGICLLIKRN